MENQSQNQGMDPVFGEVISRYTQDQAIEDGVLVHVGFTGKEYVVFTSGLFAKGYDDEIKRRLLIEKGLDILRKPDPEDSPHMRLRVIEKDRIWVIWNAGEGVTFLEPEDY